MIQFENVTCAYEKGRPVLENVSFTIRDGETVGLIGANGAGKSTLMKTALGLLPFEGRIWLDELEVNKKNLREIRRRIGFVIQDSDDQMFMPTVWEDILFGPLNYGVSREEAEKRGEALLRDLGIESLKNRHNHRISGGEKRMAAIAAVLAVEPEVLLMDEPSAALDPRNRRMVIRTINALPKTKLISSHDLDMILDTCGRVLLLSHGRIAADGEAGKILKDKELLESNHLELPLRFQQ